MQISRPLFAGGAIVCASLAFAGTPGLTELGRLVPGFQEQSRARFAIADFDGDGRDDIIVSGANGTALFQVIGQEAGGIVVKQAVLVPDTRLARVLALHTGGAPELVTVSTDGVVRRFAGWPLAEVQMFDIGETDVAAAALADIDNDGAVELLAGFGLWNRGLRVHSLATGELRWSLGDFETWDILPTQLDADPALEIVVASTPGWVIDGATQATDWSYKDGFGSYLARGHFQTGGGGQFVAARDWDLLMVFQSAPWSPVWDVPLFDIDAIAVADLDGDGIDDIIEGDGQWGSVNVFDGASHALRLEIPHEGQGIAAVAAWDPDGDGEAGIAFSPRSADWIDNELFRFADSLGGSTLFAMYNDEPGPYQRIALGPNTPGQHSLVYPYSGQFQFDAGGWVQLDAVTGQRQWRSPVPEDSDDPFAMAPRGAVRARGTGSMPQLVLAGEVMPGNARFVALDANTHVVLWVRDSTTSATLAGRRVIDMVEVDLGSSRAIASCLASDEGKRLFLMDAASGAPLWQSVAMSGEEGPCSIMAGRFSVGAAPLLVAVLDNSLRAYDANTHLLAWTLPGPLDGASLLERGANGREFVVFEGSQLRFHDAASRALLREFDLGAPISAVRQVGNDIHRVVVAAGDRLVLMDGLNGSVLQVSDYLGSGLAKGNQLAISDQGGGYCLIGVGSEGGVFRYRLYVGEGIFADGFEIAGD